MYREDFTAEHVNVWAASLRRHLNGAAHRMICVTDDPRGVDIETFPLWNDLSGLHNPSGKHLPSCYRRLKLFSGEQTRAMGIADGSYVVWIDLDVVFVRDVRPLFYGQDANFIGWAGEGAHNPVVYNGTMVQFKAASVEHLYDRFDPDKSPALVSASRFFGSDQGWLSYSLRGGAPGWSLADGMFSYSRDIKPSRRNALPSLARIVSFNGKWKPWDDHVQLRADWIKDHWRL